MVPGTVGEINQTVTYTNEQIKEILRYSAKQQLQSVNGKEPTGSSTIKFSSTPDHQDTAIEVGAVVTFICNVKPNSK